MVRLLQSPEINPRVTPERLVEFARQAYWYHTLDLGAGITTAGTYDHRPQLAR